MIMLANAEYQNLFKPENIIVYSIWVAVVKVLL